jgi:hypothetical protein
MAATLAYDIPLVEALHRSRAGKSRTAFEATAEGAVAFICIAAKPVEGQNRFTAWCVSLGARSRLTGSAYFGYALKGT